MKEIEDKILDLLKPLTMEEQNVIITNVRNIIKEDRMYNIRSLEQKLSILRSKMNNI